MIEKKPLGQIMRESKNGEKETLCTVFGYLENGILIAFELQLIAKHLGFARTEIFHGHFKKDNKIHTFEAYKKPMKPFQYLEWRTSVRTFIGISEIIANALKKYPNNIDMDDNIDYIVLSEEKEATSNKK